MNGPSAAIDWLVAQRVARINLSLGLRAPRPVLAEACERTRAAGVVLSTAAPTRTCLSRLRPKERC